MKAPTVIWDDEQKPDAARVKVRHKPTKRMGTVPQHQLQTALDSGEYEKADES